MNKLAVVVLAAGKGKRMNNPDKAKVLAEINNNPLIYYVLKAIEPLKVQKTIVVVGHQSESVKKYINDNFENIDFALQSEQLGTGHAVMMTKELLNNFEGNVLILAGDVPNITSSTLKEFFSNHALQNNDISVLSANAPSPQGYGRIIRDNNNNFLKITEHKDCSEEELRINEINSGIIIAKAKLLFDCLNNIKNNNNQGEYYLTDIIELSKNNNKIVDANLCGDFYEIQGVNTIDELRNAELYKNNRGKKCIN